MLLDSNYLLLLAGISIPAGGLFFWLRSGIRTNQLLLHAVLISFLFGLCGLISMIQQDQISAQYLYLQLASLLVGGIHIFMLHKFVAWKQTHHVLTEILFTIMIFLLGCVAFLLSNMLISNLATPWYMLTALLPFLFPFLLYKTIALWQAIPTSIYHIWQYMDHLPVPDVVAGDAIKVHLLMARDVDETNMARFTIRAPMNMKFEDVFHYFLDDYNNRNTTSPIIANSPEHSFAWYFYVKTKWWQSSQPIDPKISVYRNQLENDAVILAKRIQLESSE